MSDFKESELEPCLKSDPILKPVSKLDLVLELEPEFSGFLWGKKTLELEVNQQLITGFKLDYLKPELDLISRTGTGTGTCFYSKNSTRTRPGVPLFVGTGTETVLISFKELKPQVSS